MMLNPLIHRLDEESDMDRALGYEDFCLWRERFIEHEGDAMTEDKKNVAEMNAAELAKHIEQVDKDCKQRLKHLRALLRVLQSQEGTDG